MSQINTASSSRSSTSSSNAHAIVAATRAPHRSSDNFNVQYLVLEALCPTWPSYSDMIAAASTTTSVATAPFQCDEQLMAIFTKSVPSTYAKRRQHSTDDDVAVQSEAAGTHRNLRYECSRMGVNLLMLGRWSLHEASITSKSKLQWHVTVPHPLHGAGGPRVSFRVLECVPPLPSPPRAATVTSTAATVGPASLHGERVMFPDKTSLEACAFVYPMDYSHLCVQQRRTSGSVWNVTSDELRGASRLEEENANMQKLPAASASDTDEHHNEAVEEPWVRSVQRELLQSVRWLTAATNDDAGVPSHGSCGLLVHGPSGVGKTHQLQQLLARLPDVVSVTSAGALLQQQQNQHVRLETRYVQVPSLFELSGHPTDAAKNLCAMIRPSFVSIPSGAARSVSEGSNYFGIVNGHVCGKRLLVVVLDGVDALRADSEELFVMTAAHALAETLEQQRCAPKECDDDDDVDQRYSTNEAVVVIGVTSNVSAVHPILCSSRALMSRVIEATPPSVTLRRQLYHQHDLLLRASQSTTTLPTISPSQSPSSVADVLSNWLELTSGWIVPRILDDLAFHMNRMKDDGPKKKAQHHVPNSIVQQQGREGSHSLSSMIGVDGIVDKIERLLLFPFRHRQSLARSGVVCPKGALIVGPSGAGKTALLAALHSELRHEQRDVAQGGHQQHANKLHVIMVDALSLLHKEVGRSEKNIQALLAEARASSPSVVFFDNLDAIAPPRGKNTRETNITADRTLSTLLVELDGVRDHRDAEVLVVASAPSVESLDAAMVRPGRLDLHLELQLPTADVMAQLIVDRLFLANPDVLQLEDGVDIGTAQTEVRRIVLDRAASVGRSLTYADGVAAVRSVALHALSGCGSAAAPAMRISLRDLTDVVAEALTQR